MKLNTQKKFVAFMGALGIALAGTPALFAATMTVVNNTRADVRNSVNVSASSGSNTSVGGTGAIGGDGGSTSLAGTSAGASTAGAGGAGGSGGAGGDVVTGDAIATSEVVNDINTTETIIEDATVGVGNNYNETVRTRSMVGSSEFSALSTESMTADLSSSLTRTRTWVAGESAGSNWDENSATATNGTTTGSTSYSNTGSEYWDTHEQASSSMASNNNDIMSHDRLDSEYAAEEHDNQWTYYNRTYVNTEDNYTVSNGAIGEVDNETNVAAMSSANVSVGGEGARGSNGGSVSSAITGTSTVGASAAGAGGAGGTGGIGGTIVTGVADSLSTLITTSGHTLTRMIRR